MSLGNSKPLLATSNIPWVGLLGRARPGSDMSSVLVVVVIGMCPKYIVSLKKVWLQKIGLLLELIWSRLGGASRRENLDAKIWARKNLDVISQKLDVISKNSTSFLKKLDVISQNSTSSLKTRRHFSENSTSSPELDVISRNSTSFL